MSVIDSLVWLETRIRDRTNRVYLFLLSYVAAVASLFSYAIFGSGTGRPSTLQFGLIFVAMILGFVLALDSVEK